VSKYDFALEEFKERQARVRAEMAATGIDLLLVLSPVNVNYLIGCRAKGYQELQVLFFTLEEGPLTYLARLPEVPEAKELSLAEDVRGWGGKNHEESVDVVKHIMEEKGYLIRRIGLEVPQYYLHPHDYLKLKDVLGDSLVVEPTNLIQDLKTVKSPAEIAYMRKAANIADSGMQTAVDTITEGKTELEVAAEVHRTIMALGSDAPSSPMNFCTGERSCYAHGAPSERKLYKGDFMHLQFGPSYRRYSATIGRQLCLGKPTSRMKEVYQVARDATDAAMAEIKGGVPGIRVHEAAKKVIADAGMEQYRLHMTGYVVGPAFPPSFVDAVLIDEGSAATLKPGMIVTVEPPLFGLQDKIGVRLIENVLVTETGGEVLSKFPRDLIVL
jgi:Xaa-Pro aminopeptidase